MKKLFLILLIFSLNSYAEEEPSQEISDNKSSLNLSFSLNQGNLLFAPNTKIPAEFNTVSLGYLNQKKTNWTSVYSLEYMFNQSNAKFYSGYAGLGYTFSLLNELRVIPSFSLGLSLYKEQSGTQNVSTFGKDMQLKTQVIYNTSEKLGLILNLQWNRIMISNGFTPKDPSQEMVYDYTTFGLGVVWEL